MHAFLMLLCSATLRRACAWLRMASQDPGACGRVGGHKRISPQVGHPGTDANPGRRTSSPVPAPYFIRDAEHVVLTAQPREQVDLSCAPNASMNARMR